MIIPKRYKQFGITITTELDSEMYADSGLMGLADYQRRTIKLHDTSNNKLINRQQIEQTYCHEVFHQWLEALGYEDLRKNEQLVDQLGSLLHQFLTTKEGDLDKPE